MATATEKAWKFVEWHGQGQDCDCECWGHDEGEPCGEECRQCSWCWASDILVARNKEEAGEATDADITEAVLQMVASDREEAEGRANEAEAELERVLPWLRWVIEIKGDEPCRYDHHDYCQAHNLDERPCPVEQIQKYLDELDDGEVDLSSPFTDELGKSL